MLGVPVEVVSQINRGVPALSLRLLRLARTVADVQWSSYLSIAGTRESGELGGGALQG